MFYLINKKILFRLFNPKLNGKIAFNIYEKAKLSTTIELAYNNSYRLIDVRYDTSTDTHTLNRKYVNLLVDLPQYLNKSKKYKAVQKVQTVSNLNK